MVLGDHGLARGAPFIELMRQKGYEVISNEVAGLTGKGLEVRVPEKGLFLMFVTSEMCRGSGTR